jgi:hypothetical protein
VGNTTTHVSERTEIYGMEEMEEEYSYENKR